MDITLAVVVLILAAIPAFLFVWNLMLYRPPRSSAGGDLAGVSVLIPARDEERSIGAALRSVLSNRGVAFEVIVLDDASLDSTAAIVQEIAARDPRVRYAAAPPLPQGWCGKQHACAVLAGMARHPVLCFMDADVRLAGDTLARMAGFLRESGAALVSGFPQQRTDTWLEKLLIPLIHVVLLGYLPLWRMRASTQPAYAAGCGQLMMARRDSYVAAGGHAGIRATLHDGINLPKAFRRAGFRTDLFDATTVASCRMYTNAREVWSGLAKNATEGMASPSRIVPFSVLLLGGHVMPWVLLAMGAPLAAEAVCVSLLPRVLGVLRFRQNLSGAVLHPLGVLLLVAVQWYALAASLRGRPAAWKGRAYPHPQRG